MTHITDAQLRQLIADLCEARDTLTAATSAGVPLDRAALWHAAGLVAGATQYAHSCYSYDRPLSVIGEHHAEVGGQSFHVQRPNPALRGVD